MYAMICKNSHTGTDSHLFLKGCLNSVPIHILSFPSVAEDVFTRKVSGLRQISLIHLSGCTTNVISKWDQNFIHHLIC